MNTETINMFDAYKMYWKNYVKFDGRSRRSEYWWVILMNFIINIILSILTLIPYLGVLFGVISVIYGIACIIPSLSLCFRRLHDTGKCGLFILLALIPIVGIIILLIWFVKDSDPGINKYGPSPKEAY